MGKSKFCILTRKLVIALFGSKYACKTRITPCAKKWLCKTWKDAIDNKIKINGSWWVSQLRKTINAGPKLDRPQLQALFRSAIALQNEQANEGAAQSCYSFCFDQWFDGDDMRHCVVCNKCHTCDDDDRHWTCRRCRKCINGINRCCLGCKGVSARYLDDLDEPFDSHDNECPLSSLEELEYMHPNSSFRREQLQRYGLHDNYFGDCDEEDDYH